MIKACRIRWHFFPLYALAPVVLSLAFQAFARAQAPPSDPAGRSQPPEALRRAVAASNNSASRHPLDPLEPVEIEFAVASVRKQRRLTDSVRFVTVCLNEPSKAVVRQSRSGGSACREAFLILLDNATGRGYEAVVDLSTGDLNRYEMLPEGVQPPIMIDEFGECEEAVRQSPAFREAMKKRGVEDMSLVMVDAWSAGHYGNEPA